MASLEVDADLALKIGDAADDLQKLCRKIAMLERNTARVLKIPFSGSIAASQATTISVGEGPNLGRMWDIKRVSVAQINPSATVPSGVSLYLFTVPNIGSAALTGDNLVWGSTSFPAFDKFGAKQVTLQHGEVLALMAVNGTTVFTLSGQLQVLDYPLYGDDDYYAS
jgi:hypothetical protein